MSQTKNEGELDSLIIEDVYGELASRIFATLYRRGRATAAALGQHTRLPLRYLHHGLAALVQQNLVHHSYDEDVSATVYEAARSSAYFAIRSGKVVDNVRMRHGTAGAAIVQDLLLLGHATLGQLVEAFESSDMTEGGNTEELSAEPNGHVSNVKDTNLCDTPGVVRDMLETGLLEPLDETVFRSSADQTKLAEREVLKRYTGGLRGTKQKEEFKAAVMEYLRDARSRARAWRGKKGNKRPAEDTGSEGVKRRKLANGYGKHETTQSNSLEMLGIDPSLVVRINEDKCCVAIRSQLLVALAKHNISETTSEVYASLLRQLERGIPACRLDPTYENASREVDGPVATSQDVSENLREDLDLGSGIGKTSDVKSKTNGINGTTHGHKPSRNANVMSIENDDISEEDQEASEDDTADNGDDHEADEEDEERESSKGPRRPRRPPKVTFSDALSKTTSNEDRQKRVFQIRHHLLLLAEHDPPFVRRCGTRGFGEWTVDFEQLAIYMKRKELGTYLRKRFERHGQRIIEILNEKGKLDEKTIHNMALMKQRDVRTKLVEMQMAGFVDIQEVPKDNSRAPNRTIFLWYFDEPRVSDIILDVTLKAMARHLQILEVEKLQEKDVLSLAERSDVRGQEHILDRSQLARLDQIREKEEKLLVQIARLDEIVGIFRDFGPAYTSEIS